MATSSTLQELANFLSLRTDTVISQFITAVRVEPEIRTTDELPTPQIVDTIPLILGDLIDELRSPGDPEQLNQSLKRAHQHGKSRLNQNYQLNELLRELAALRHVLLFQLAAFDQEQPEIDPIERLRVQDAVHTFIDLLMIDSTEQFLKPLGATGLQGRPPE